MLLATAPLHPASFSTKDGSKDSTQYISSQDIKTLLAPVEFVEGSSSGGLAVPEGRYEPINRTPKASKATKEEFKSNHDKPTKTPALMSTGGHVKSVQSLFTGTLDVAWPTGIAAGSGLFNNGNTCFLNSALQCLLHTPPLLHVLAAHKKGDKCRVNPSHFCMSCSLRDIMVQSFTGKHPFLPKAISGRLNMIAKHMRKGRQEDSHEFLRYAIDALQKSCLAGLPPKIDPKLAETTWVHKIFGGRLRSRVACRECYYNSDTYDSILDLSLDILRQSSLKEALHHFVKVDTLKGADKYKCEKCKKPVVAEKSFTVHNAPMVLTVHLKRFSPLGRKISHPIHYDERISLQPVMSEGQFGPSYSLYGVISHAGSGPNSGHYYAHVKAGNGQWYEMNDESVTPSRTPTALKNAYMLFYVMEKGQALKAVVSQISGPTKNGVAAGMKKRKATDNDPEDRGVSAARPFIGPVLPSSPAATSPSHLKNADPQAEAIKKKIEAAAKAKTNQALQNLSQYGDDDDESDMDAAPEKQPLSSAATTPHIALSSPPAHPPASSPVTPQPIPASNFYSSSNENDMGKKRKSPDHEGDENQHTEQSSSRGSSRYRTDSIYSRKPKYSGNPYNRIPGAENLSRRDSSTKHRKLTTYSAKRRRGFAI